MKKLFFVLAIGLVSLSSSFACGVHEEANLSNVKKAMDRYINEDIGLKGGYFLIYDPQAKKVLQLNFEGLHEKVKLIKEEKAYYACADFRSLDGAILYDIDFWVEKGSYGKLKVKKIIIHKENGKERFSYGAYTLLPVGKGYLSPEAGSHMAPEAGTHFQHKKHQHKVPEAGSY